MVSLWRYDSEFPWPNRFIWYLKGLCQAFEEALEQSFPIEPFGKFNPDIFYFFCERN